jgi:hypothetical protein
VAVVCYALPFVLWFVVRRAFAGVCVSLNWMSRQEAAEYLPPFSHWPESWLEPRPIAR